MKHTYTLLVALALAVVFFATGCFTKRDNPAEERAVLHAGQQVSADMVGWVAVPNTAPAMHKQGDLSYAVLATHNVIPAAVDGWVAMNPAFFAKLSDIKPETPAAGDSERWALSVEGKSVPKDKDGWVALPYSEPQIEKSASGKDREMAALANGNVVPKEMHGWVAVTREDLAKLVEKFMHTGPGSKVTK